MQHQTLRSPSPLTEKECYQLLMENVVDYAIFTLDVQQRIVTWNAGAERILAYQEETIIGKHFDIIFTPEDKAQGIAEKEAQKAKQEGRANDERWHQRKDGSQFWAMGILTALRDESGELRGFVKILRDMTAHKTAEEALQRSQAALLQTNLEMQQHLQRIQEQAAELERQKVALQKTNARLETLAATDGLTGLKNHRTFQERLREEVGRAARYNAPLSLLLLDVDHFKSYNDAFGHPAGDAVLQQVAEVLQATARASDLTARYGGEEFAVILPKTTAAEAKVAAERVRMAIETADWQKRPVTISVGIATLSLIVPESSFFIRQADMALYRAKQCGRNCTYMMPSPSAVTAGLPAIREPDFAGYGSGSEYAGEVHLI